QNQQGIGLVKETTNGSTALQPWLVGLTAVTVFLFVMFVANLINRIFFSQKYVSSRSLSLGFKRQNLHHKSKLLKSSPPSLIKVTANQVESIVGLKVTRFLSD
uniref:Uncharacterized protein n=1 Tax=Naja naja TaxID=35670 RepID=A0A8C6XVI8_NAJNA